MKNWKVTKIFEFDRQTQKTGWVKVAVRNKRGGLIYARRFETGPGSDDQGNSLDMVCELLEELGYEIEVVRP